MTEQEKIIRLETELASTADLREQADIMLNILDIYSSLKNDAIKIYIERLKQISSNLSSDEYLAWVYYYKGVVYRISDNHSAALEESQKGLEIFTSINNQLGIAKSYNIIGSVYDKQGNYTKALSNYFSSLKIWEEIGDRRGIPAIHNSIGSIYGRQGKYPEALADTLTALKIGEEIGDKVEIAMSHNNIGIVCYYQGDYHRALTHHFAALKIREEIGAKNGIANSLNNIGNVYFIQGNYPEALSNYFSSLKIREVTRNKRGIAESRNNIGIIYYNQGDYQEALSNHFSSLKIRQEIKDISGIASSYTNIGSVYSNQDNYHEALSNYFSSLRIREEIGDKRGIADSYNKIGTVYFKQSNYRNALSNNLLALKIYEEIGDNSGIAAICNYIANDYIALKAYALASDYLTNALKMTEEMGANKIKILTLELWYKLKKAEGDGMAALAYHEKFVAAENILMNEEASKKIAGLQFGYQIEKKEQEVTFERNKNEALQLAYDLLDKEKQRSEELLLNILPAEVAEELKANDKADAKLFEDVTVFFSDFKSFTKLSEKLSPQQLVNELHECFSAFDNIISKYNVEKIKTVGDAYLAVSGLPVANPNHASDVVKAALEIQQYITNRIKARDPNKVGLGEIRVGIHSGQVVAGIVGVKKFAYDIWGDTVNTAARMEQNGEAGKINISEATYTLVKDKFKTEFRGEIDAKNKGKLKMYFVS